MSIDPRCNAQFHACHDEPGSRLCDEDFPYPRNTNASLGELRAEREGLEALWDVLMGSDVWTYHDLPADVRDHFIDLDERISALSR